MHPRLGMKPVADEDWTPLPGFEGLHQVALSSNLDETAKKGHRVRLVRFAPGVKTDTTLVHDYFEETYLVSGSLTLLDDADATAVAPSFVFRPPGTPHGPFISKDGCVMLEIQYYP